MGKIKVEVLKDCGLTPRQADVLALLIDGSPDKTIARRLDISLRTVENHTSAIYQRLGIKVASINARCAAISRAIASGVARVSLLGLVLAAVWHDGAALQPVRSARVTRAAGSFLVRRVRDECV